MYNIIRKQNNNKTLYTVVFVTHHLSLPMYQSYDYIKCYEYINDKMSCDNKSWQLVMLRVDGILVNVIYQLNKMTTFIQCKYECQMII